MRNKVRIGTSLLIAALLLCGCSPWIHLEQPVQNSTTPLEPSRSLGQTFTPHENGLQGIAVYLSPIEAKQGDVRLRLQENIQGVTEAITATLPLVDVQQPGWYQFSFPEIDGSAKKDYYFELSLTDSGKLSLATGSADSYLDGSLYQDGQPVEAQASFRLAYDPLLATTGRATEGADWVLYLLAAFWLFVIPGWGLLSVLYRDWIERAWIEKIALAAGISLALYPLMFLWTGLAGLKLGVAYAWLPGVAGLALIGYKQLARYRSGNFKARISYQRENLLPDLMLVVLFILLIFSRLWVIRELDYPMWGDSYQHSMIAQLMVNNRGLFDNWLPYTELRTFTYHFGFHTFVAVYHWLTGMPLPTATLWTGQIINILAIVTLVPLANRLGGNRWAGVIAVLVAALLSPMPQAYVNWGRYTQLAGQAILPVVIIIALVYLARRPIDRSLIILLSITMGGLALTHYRVLIFAALFFLAYVILRARRNNFQFLLRSILWIAFGAILLSLPWLIHTLEGGIPRIAAAQLSTPVSQLSAFAKQYNSTGNVGNYLSPVLWVVMLIASAWSFWRREIDAVNVVLWWLLLALAANPLWLNLPGSGIINNFSILIAVYIPAGVLIGAAAGWLADLPDEKHQARTKYKTFIQLGLVAVLLLCSYYGVRSRLKDDNPQGSSLFTRADQRAAAWIDANLPQQARLLVNAFFAYADTVIVGSDGGWWLPLAAHRLTSLPPINYGNEEGIQPDYRQHINILQSEILSKGINHPDVLRLLDERGIRYIYIGQRQGRVNNQGATLDPQVLLTSPSFKPIYHQDRVYIFEVVQ
jgi:hypothetical protein